MRIIGIDPGYAIMGYGIVEYKGSKFTPIVYGSITTEAHTPNEERLMTLYDELSAIIAEYKPEEASIEDLKQKGRIGVVNACLRLKIATENRVRFIIESEKGIGTTIGVVIPREYINEKSIVS